MQSPPHMAPLPPSWLGVGSGRETGRDKKPGTQPSLPSSPALEPPPTHSHAPPDPHGQHVVVEALGLQAAHLPVQLHLLPLEALQSVQKNGGL